MLTMMCYEKPEQGGKGTPGTGHGMCKGSEVGVSLMCLRTCEEADVAAAG